MRGSGLPTVYRMRSRTGSARMAASARLVAVEAGRYPDQRQGKGTYPHESRGQIAYQSLH